GPATPRAITDTAPVAGRPQACDERPAPAAAGLTEASYRRHRNARRRFRQPLDTRGLEALQMLARVTGEVVRIRRTVGHDISPPLAPRIVCALIRFLRKARACVSRRRFAWFVSTSG